MAANIYRERFIHPSFCGPAVTCTSICENKLSTHVDRVITSTHAGSALSSGDNVHPTGEKNGHCVTGYVFMSFILVPAFSGLTSRKPARLTAAGEGMIVCALFVANVEILTRVHVVLMKIPRKDMMQCSC